MRDWGQTPQNRAGSDAMSLPWLSDDDPLPPVEQAMRRPNGLLAAGGGLSVRRLADAYRSGCFPWYSQGEPVLWWSPDPRMVLVPAELHVPRSLARRMRRGDITITADRRSGSHKRLRGAARRPGRHLDHRRDDAA